MVPQAAVPVLCAGPGRSPFWFGSRFLNCRSGTYGSADRQYGGAVLFFPFRCIGYRSTSRAAGRSNATHRKAIMTDEPKITGVYEFLDALRDVIISSDPARRKTLAKTIDAWAEDFPDEFHWATGIQAPVLLHHLLMEVDESCRPDAASKPRPVIRLVDRKPQGGA